MNTKSKQDGRELGRAQEGRCIVCSGTVEHPDGGSGTWCHTCLDGMAKSLVISFHKAGRLDELELTLSRLAEQTRSPVWQYYLGLVLAEAGKIETSIELLHNLLTSDKSHAEAPSTLTALLAYRASLRLKDRKYKEVADDLSFAVGLEPDNEDVKRSILLVKGIDALMRIDHDTRGEQLAGVVKMLQKMQSQQPDNHILTHNLAVLSYRLASEAEEAGKEKLADSAWNQTIANWSLLLYEDGFWTEWAERERSLYELNTTADDIRSLRQAIRNRLLQDFRNYRAWYHEVNNPDRARRHREYEILFLLETKTARAMREVLNLLRKSGLPVPVSVPAGPLMLKTLGLLASAHEMVTQAQGHPVDSEKVQELKDCLSPIGRIELLMENGWMDQAEVELDKVLGKEPSNSPIRSLMATVLKEQGKQLAKLGKWEEAVRALEKCLEYTTSTQDLEDAIVSSCLDTVRQLSETGEEKDLDKAIKVLETTAKGLPRNEQLKESLATRYTRRAILLINKDRRDEGIEELKRALKLDEDNGLALQNIQIAIWNKTVALSNADNYDQAIEVGTKGLKYGEPPDLKRLLSRLHNTRAVVRHDQHSDISGCRQDLLKALEYDPSNDSARNNLSKL